ncbi:hypothetical protein F5Y18DRAFT_428057 [Xylariaceae sp. FL1019]|nr:hypothetical protein F5Y18DRAFT_428057 [Xylariaceae sp. FL1019]
MRQPQPQRRGRPAPRELREPRDQTIRIPDGFDVVWDQLENGTYMGIGGGKKHEKPMLDRIAESESLSSIFCTGRGTYDNPRVVWLAQPPTHNRMELDTLLQEQASRMKQAYVWVMMGVHYQSTVGRTKTRTPRDRYTEDQSTEDQDAEDQYTQGLRIMSQDDPHLTVRFGPDKDRCTLHGHLYVHVAPKKIGPNKYITVPTGRLMTEAERTFVGGRPRHLWIWGPYNRPCPAWPRSKIQLPKPDPVTGEFEVKEEYAKK